MIIINKIETVVLRVVKDERGSKGKMPDWLIHWVCGLKNRGCIIPNVMALRTNLAIH